MKHLTAPWRHHLKEVRRYYPLSLLTALAVGILVTVLPTTSFIEVAELKTHDIRHSVRGHFKSAPSGTRVVFVALDEATERAWPEPMAFWGGHFADLIRGARKLGARAVGLDIVLQSRGDEFLESLGRPERRTDRLLGEAIQEPGAPVVLATHVDMQGREAPLAPIWDYLLGEAIAPMDLPRSADGVARQAYLYDVGAKGSAVVYPSFSGLLAAKAQGISATSSEALERLAQSRTDFRQGHSTYWVEAQKDMVPTLSAVDLSHWETLPTEKRRLFEGAVVVIGQATAELPTVGGGTMSPALFQSYAVASIMGGQPLARLRQEVEWVVMFVLVLIGIGLLLHPRPKMRLFGPVVGGIAYWALALVMAVKTGWLLPMVAPTLGLLAPPVAYYAMRSREERNRREEIEHRFGRSVSPRLVDWYLAQEETIPDQEEREVTILFFDVRGSTNLGSTMEPRAFHRRMNELLGPVSEILERHDGLISRYTGDGFLAFFNAPNDVPNHAIKALFAATEIITYVQQHNQKVSESQRLGVGCGLNTGIVSCGMLGQASRAEYTVLGDVINVAAKLEALNKDNQTELTISASVAAATQEHLQAGVLPLTLRVSADQPIGTRPLEDEDGTVRWVPRRFAYFGYNVESI